MGALQVSEEAKDRLCVALDRGAHDSRPAATGVEDGCAGGDVLLELGGQHRTRVGHGIGLHPALLLRTCGEGSHRLQLLLKALDLLDLYVLSALQLLLQQQVDLPVGL
eukprot:2528615-Prymnesium_polylepis.1